MPSPWISEFWRLTFYLAVALLLGGLTGYTGVLLVVFLGTYLGWILHHLYELHQWFSGPQGRTPPDAPGVWGDIYYHIHRLQTRNKKRKKKLANMLSRFQESTAAMPDATVVLNVHHEIEWMNKAVQPFLGLNSKRDVGQRIDNLVRAPEFIAYLNGSNHDEPLQIHSPADKQLMLSVRVIDYGKKQKLLVFRDITRIKQLERMRSDFLANVSHELRTPITVINGYLENLIDAPEYSPETWDKILNQMLSQGQRMQHLVDDLLLLSRLESEERRPQQQAIMVPSIINSIEQEMAVLLAEYKHNLILDVNTSICLSGDEKEIYSAFSNLVLNAIKYTPEGGEICVSWQTEGEGAAFKVVDSGIGIAAEHIPRLTERFYRVDTGRSRDRGGTGLGLAIVKHILQRHSGELRISSQLGKGSVFSCCFPASQVIPCPVNNHETTERDDGENTDL